MMVTSVPVHKNRNSSNSDDDEDEDVCRFCRAGNAPGRPLFHPCKCIGSIRYIHQECLLQWMKHSKKEFCELCKHPIKFQPIYAASMPHWLPIGTLVNGLIRTLMRAVKLWLHYSLVAMCWLAFVPLVSYRTYKCLFNRSLSPLLAIPYDTVDVILADCFKGGVIVLISFCVILSLVWLRDQIVNGGGPEWLINNNHNNDENVENENDGEQNNAEQNAFESDDEVNPAVQEARIGDNEIDEIIEAMDLQIIDNQEAMQEPIQEVQQVLQRDNLIDRAAEELTWERMLGMDGSLVFVEYVFWVATLNIISITIFGLIPYHLGGTVTYFLGVDKQLEASLIGKCFILLAGYVVVFLFLAHGHTIANYFDMSRISRVLGVGYIIVKVGLLLTTEVVIFPTLSGWWIDICTLTMFDSTLKDRINSLYTAPGTTTFLHWLVGMVFVFYFASFVLLLRRVLRPGVLWFLKNLNDPDFHPVQEMISYSMFKHIRRFCISCVVFGCSIMLIFLAPLKFIQVVFSRVIPYSVEMSTESILGEISLELLLLQVVLPQLLEQSNTKQWFKNCIEVWARVVAKLLGLRSYLLGDIPHKGENCEDGKLINIVVPGYANNIEGLGTGAAQTGPNAEIFVPFQPYYKPSQFKLRVLALVGVTCCSMFILFVFVLSVPVTLGRAILQFFMPAGQLHELYTFSCGLYTIWAITRLSTMVYNWAVQGLTQFLIKVKEWLIVIAKCVYVALTVCGLIPLLFGLLYEMILLLPLRVPLWHTPILLLWQDWGLGILFVKILYAATLTGPDWYLKRVLEQVFQTGVMQMDIKFVTNNLVLPIVVTQLHLLCIPYTLCSILPSLGFSNNVTHVCHRRIYPVSVMIFLSFLFLIFQINQFKRLYEKIKNEKYLIGTRLVNFHGEEKHVASTQ